MKKVILAAMIAAAIPASAYAQYESKICSDNVVVEGCLSQTNSGKDLYVLLEKDGKVEYINNFNIESNGRYTAKFKFAPDSDISDYTVRVKAGGEDATDSILKAASKKDAMIFDVNLKNSDGKSYIDNDGTINITGNIKNYYSDSGSCVMLAAVYDVNGVMKSVQKKDVDYTYNIDNALDSWSINASTGDKVKVFVWDNTSTMIPLATEKSVCRQTYGSDVMKNPESNITAVFLGDSIYQGAGASSSDANLESHMQKYFSEHYNSATVINAGIGGTYSDQGLYRIKKDVAKHNPDIVFVDFCGNDRYLSQESYMEYMEGIARELISLPHQPVIVYNFPAIYYEEGKGHNYPQNTYWAKEIADHYGITTVNYYDYIQERIKNGDFTDIKDFADKFTKDTVHPNDEGYRLMAEHLINSIEDGSAYKKYELKEKYGSYEFKNPGLVAANSERVSYSGTWQYKPASDTFEDGTYLSSQGGDKITFTFTGKSIGFYIIRSANGNTATYSIDNGKYNGTIGTNGAGPMSMTVGERHNLDDGKHTITITTSEPTESDKNLFEIGYFMTDELNN